MISMRRVETNATAAAAVAVALALLEYGCLENLEEGISTKICDSAP